MHPHCLYGLKRNCSDQQLDYQGYFTTSAKRDAMTTFARLPLVNLFYFTCFPINSSLNASTLLLFEVLLACKMEFQICLYEIIKPKPLTFFPLGKPNTHALGSRIHPDIGNLSTTVATRLVMKTDGLKRAKKGSAFSGLFKYASWDTSLSRY